MPWNDLGLIFRVDRLSEWAHSHAYVPTALDLGDHIRVYAAFWDANKHGRLGYIDVDGDDPTKVLAFSADPILSDAEPERFDSDGVTPLSIVRDGSALRLYYAGWRRLRDQEARYTLFTGLAVSRNGERFERYQVDPVLGPTKANSFVRTGGFFMRDAGRWRCWFADFVENVRINDAATPSYCLATLDSHDGIHWPDQAQEVFPVIPGHVFGYGRGAVWKSKGRYKGLFSVRYLDGGYRSINYSESPDGYRWAPLSDRGLAFTPRDSCDEQSELAFPTLVLRDDRMFMFYNGDNFGRDGLRAAVWTRDTPRA